MASLTDLKAKLDELRTDLADIDKEHAGERLADDVKARWNDLNEEYEQTRKTIEELEERAERVAELSTRDSNTEKPATDRRGLRVGKRVPDNLFDLAEYRSMTSTEEQYGEALRDGAMKVIENASFPHPDAKREEQQAHIARLLDTIDRSSDEDMPRRALARRIIATSDPVYQRAFAKHLAQRPLNQDEARALGIGSQGGGYPVPIVLDPTVILTSNGQVNPIRQLARVEPIVGNTWNGVSSAGITASYSAEAVEATDNSPTLTQPSLNVEKAKAFVPFSIEAGEDWGSLQSEMARLLQDAKDALESTKFAFGAGHGSQEPQGLLVGATAIVTTAATATFAVADIYSLLEGLPPRWQPGASFVANLKYLNKIRQFDTYGGASLWVQLGNGTPSRLLDIPTFQYSAYSTAATSGASIVTIGDFSQYLIADRIGMNIELVPQLFGTVSNYPTGQRGLFAYWRNSAVVLSPTAFKTLKLL